MQQVEANGAEAGHLGPASPCMGLSWRGSRSQKGRQNQASQRTLKMSFKTSSTMQSSSAAFHEGRMRSGEMGGGVVHGWLNANIPGKEPHTPQGIGTGTGKGVA